MSSGRVGGLLDGLIICPRVGRYNGVFCGMMDVFIRLVESFIFSSSSGRDLASVGCPLVSLLYICSSESALDSHVILLIQLPGKVRWHGQQHCYIFS